MIQYAYSSFATLAPNELLELVRDNPSSLRELFGYYDSNTSHLSDLLLDTLLGVQEQDIEQFIDHQILEERYGIEQYIYEGRPYDYCRRFLHVLQPTDQDKVYDLGCGYGRVVFYGALTTPAYYTGIELVPERVINANRIKQRYSIHNAEFLQGNVLDYDYSDGTLFFLFNPFISATLEKVIARLQLISQYHPIKIVAWGGGASRRISGEPWLNEIPLPRDGITLGPTGLQIFVSKY